MYFVVYDGNIQTKIYLMYVCVCVCICSLYNNGNFLIFFNYSTVEYFYDLLKHPSRSSINFRILVFAKLEYHMLVGIRITKIQI